MRETWTSGPFQRELGRLDTKDAKRIVEALRRFALDQPVDVRPVAGAASPGTVRIRVGPYRIIGSVLPDRDLVYWTTLFRKRRDQDYQKALRRHDARMADNPGAPGPHNP